MPPVNSHADIPVCANYFNGLGFRDVKVNFPLTPECSVALKVAFSFELMWISKLANALESFNMPWLEAGGTVLKDVG